MGSYLVGFSVYTLAMIGIVFIGFVVVKKCSIARRGAKSHNNFLEIETSLSLEARKTVHVIRAGSERILLATDAESTTFLTKLQDGDEVSFESKQKEVKNNTKYCSSPIPKVASHEDISFELKGVEQPKVFRDLMKRLQEE